MATQTSISAFKQIQPKRKSQVQRILDVFLKYPQLRFSDRDLSKLTRIPRFLIPDRRGQCARKGWIAEAGVEFDVETKMRVQMWKLADQK